MGETFNSIACIVNFSASQEDSCYLAVVISASRRIGGTWAIMCS